jgi:hypothetical protein
MSRVGFEPTWVHRLEPQPSCQSSLFKVTGWLITVPTVPPTQIGCLSSLSRLKCVSFRNGLSLVTPLHAGVACHGFHRERVGQELHLLHRVFSGILSANSQVSYFPVFRPLRVRVTVHAADSNLLIKKLVLPYTSLLVFVVFIMFIR